MLNLYEIVLRHAVEQPRRIALSVRQSGCGFVTVDYAELIALVQRFVAAYEQLVTAERRVIPLLVGKSPHSVAAMLAAIGIDRPFCFLNAKYRGPQIAAVLESTGAPFGVVDPAGLVALRDTWKQHPIIAQRKWLIVGEPKGEIYERAESQLRQAAPTMSLPDLLADTRRSGAPRPIRDDVEGACLFTSGSTGEPKGVRISEADLMARSQAEIEWFGLSRDDVLLNILPFSFDVGLNQLLSALTVGCELVLCDSWLPIDLREAVVQRRVTGIAGVPALWQDLIRAGVRLDIDEMTSSLRYITVSGGSLAPSQVDQLQPMIGRAGIFKTYGQSEAFRTASLRPEELNRKPLSVGRAFPGARFYVVDEAGRRCRSGEIGEIVHTGLGVMMGYLAPANADESLRKRRRNPFQGPEDPSEWAVFTGDLGYADEDGFLFLKGRRDGMIKVMGNRVYPQEVTHQVLAVSGIRDAVVAVVDDPPGSAALIAFVVTEPSSRLSAASIRQALKSRLPAYMVPRRICLVGEIPRTTSGKPDSRQLLAEIDGGLCPSARGEEPT